MIGKFEACLIMFGLYVITAILHYWQLKLEDSNSSYGLQNLLCIVTLATGFLSLPITLISFGIQFLYANRVIKQNDRQISELRTQVILLSAENKELSEKLSRYDRQSPAQMRHNADDLGEDYDIGYNAGYDAGYDTGYDVGYDDALNATIR